MTELILATDEEKEFLYNVRAQTLGDGEPSRDDVKAALLIIGRGLNSREVSAKIKATKAAVAKSAKPSQQSLDDLFGE